MQKKIKKIKNVTLYKNKDLTKYSTLRLKSYADLIVVETTSALKEILPYIPKYHILGSGSNALLPLKSSIPFIQLKMNFDKSLLEKKLKTYTFPASAASSLITRLALKYKFKNFDLLSGIPGTLGGAIFGNACISGRSLSEIISKVQVISQKGKERWVKISRKSFKYRANTFLKSGDVITQVTFIVRGFDPHIKKKVLKHLKKRSDSQPVGKKTLGCTFKNHHSVQGPCPAGLSLDILGLKGLKYKDLELSKKHANFIEHTGNASSQDFLSLVQILREELCLNFSLTFKLELKSFE